MIRSDIAGPKMGRPNHNDSARPMKASTSTQRNKNARGGGEAGAERVPGSVTFRGTCEHERKPAAIARCGPLVRYSGRITLAPEARAADSSEADSSALPAEHIRAAAGTETGRARNPESAAPS